MIGLDTNIIIRYLVEDDEEQSKQAKTIVDQLTHEEPGFISLVTLLETVWLLQRSYRVSRKDLLQTIAVLAESPVLVLQEVVAVKQALGMAEAANHDLPDALLAVLGKRAGCVATLTFDRRASGLPGMKLVPLLHSRATARHGLR